MKSAIGLVAAMAFSMTAQAAPVTYIVDAARTSPWFEFSYFGKKVQRSRFERTTGSITLDREARTGGIDIKIDASSVNTGNPVLNNLIRSQDFFDADTYPEVIFSSRELQFDGDKLTGVRGRLKIKNVSRPVELQVTSFYCLLSLQAGKEVCGAAATTTLRRSEFNMGKYAPLVSDEVSLNIVIEAMENTDAKP